MQCFLVFKIFLHIACAEFPLQYMCNKLLKYTLDHVFSYQIAHIFEFMQL